MLQIIDVETGVLYVKHSVSTGKGELIGESSRKNRDKSKTLLELESAVLELFNDSDEEKAGRFLERIHREKTRYYRDQLGVIRSLFTEWTADLIGKALNYCIEHELYSASELKSAVAFVACLEDEAKNTPPRTSALKLPEEYRGGDPILPNLSVYDEAMGRRVANG